MFVLVNVLADCMIMTNTNLHTISQHFRPRNCVFRQLIQLESVALDLAEKIETDV